MSIHILAEGLSFPESPRWHEGYFYFSDFNRHVVERIDEAGVQEIVAKVPGQPSGLGWLPDGRLLIVSMTDRKLLVQEKDGSLNQYADLSGLATFHCNDMVVDAKGRAYVGNFGFDTHGEGPKLKAHLIRVDPDGTVSSAADDLTFPNGTVITPDGKSMIIAETYGHRLTAFDIDANGTLSNRRIWADLGRRYPDGICLDAEGMIWVADPGSTTVVRVKEGGEIVQTIDVGRPAFACALGGADRKTLHICAANGSGPEALLSLSGQILITRVAVPAAG